MTVRDTATAFAMRGLAGALRLINVPINSYLVSPQKQTNPASVFIRLAIFNAIGGIVFLIFYFLYSSSGGTSSYYLLIAAGAGFVAMGGSLVAYRIFKAKLDAMKK